MNRKQIQQYTEDCLRTWKLPNNAPVNTEGMPEELADRVVKYASDAATYEELAHLTMGLSSEILSELEPAFAFRDTVNIKEELGDIQYFLLVLANRLSVDVSEAFNVGFMLKFSSSPIAKLCVDSPFKCLKYQTGTLIDVLKKVYIYKNPKYGNKDIETAVLSVQYSIERVANKNSFTSAEAIEAVIAKLKERFKEKFTVEEVSNRDLDAERKALES